MTLRAGNAWDSVAYGDFHRSRQFTGSKISPVYPVGARPGVPSELPRPGHSPIQDRPRVYKTRKGNYFAPGATVKERQKIIARQSSKTGWEDGLIDLGIGVEELPPHQWEYSNYGAQVSPKFSPAPGTGIPKPPGGWRRPADTRTGPRYSPQTGTRAVGRWVEWERPFVKLLRRSPLGYILKPDTISDGTLTDEQWRNRNDPAPFEVAELFQSPSPVATTPLPPPQWTSQPVGQFRPINWGFEFYPKPRQYPEFEVNYFPSSVALPRIEAHPWHTTRPRQEDDFQVMAPQPVTRPRTELEVQITQKGMRIRRMREPRLARTSRMARDQKSGAGKAYTMALAMVNRSLGRLTEAKDVVDAIMWNTVDEDGVPVFPRLGYMGTMRAIVDGYAHVDIEGALYTLALQQMMDAVIGKTSKGVRDQLRDAGYSRPVGVTLGTAI